MERIHRKLDQKKRSLNSNQKLQCGMQASHCAGWLQCPSVNQRLPQHSLMYPFHTQIYFHLKRKGTGKKEKKIKQRTFGFLQHTFSMNTFSTLPQTLSPRISVDRRALQGQRSQQGNLLQPPESPSLPPAPAPRAARFSPLWKKPSCVSHYSHPKGPAQNPEYSWKQLS